MIKDIIKVLKNARDQAIQARTTNGVFLTTEKRIVVVVHWINEVVKELEEIDKSSVLMPREITDDQYHAVLQVKPPMDIRAIYKVLLESRPQ